MSRASQVAVIAVSAALYAAAKAATAYVPTPWGVGQFAPGIIVPVFFAVVSAPLVAAVGAAIGVFIGDLYLSSLGLTTPLLSLTAGVPSHLVGIFLLSWLVSKYPSWKGFVWSSVLALVVGNVIAASGVVAYLVYLPLGIPPQIVAAIIGRGAVAAIFGFALFWIATMVPFVVAFVPVLVRAVRPLRGRTGSGIQPPQWADSTVGRLLPSSALLASLFGALALVVAFTPLGQLIFSPIDPFWLWLLVGITAISLLIFGPLAPKLGRTSTSTAPLPSASSR